MNQHQRTHLINKLKDEINSQIKEIKAKTPKRPIFSEWLKAQVLEGKFEVKFSEEIKSGLMDYAKKQMLNKEGVNWLVPEKSNGWRDDEDGDYIKLPVRLILEFGAEYEAMLSDWSLVKAEVDFAIAQLEQKRNSMEMRIQLASPKMLETLIEDVDVLGQIRMEDLVIQAPKDVKQLMEKINSKTLFLGK